MTSVTTQGRQRPAFVRNSTTLHGLRPVMRRVVLLTIMCLAALGAGLAWSAARGVSSEPRHLVSSEGSPYGAEFVSLTRVEHGFLAAYQVDSAVTLRRLGAKGN